MSKKAWLVILIVVLVFTFLYLAGLSVVSDSFYSMPSMEDNDTLEDVPYNVTIRGTYGCLNHRNQEGPQTLECALGIFKADIDAYYALDVSQIKNGIIDSIQTGDTLEIYGLLVPIEQISSDMWQKYDVDGIIQVKKLTKINPK